MTEPERTNEMRSLIATLGLSQSEAAEKLEVNPREFRYWAACNPAPPMVVLYALRHLATQK